MYGSDDNWSDNYMPRWCSQSVEQLAFADIILLNKIDLVTEDDKKRITARIKVILAMCNQVK